MRVVPSRPEAPRLEPMRLDGVTRIAMRFPDANLRETAVVRTPELDTRADPSGQVQVWLALEALQVTGSFKVRGALVALDRVLRTQGRGAKVVAASAGNHGAGVAYAASVLGLEATVVVPSGVPEVKRQRIERAGAEVRFAATDHYDDAESEALALAARTGATFVSAYDDEDVVAGNGGSLGYDIARSMGVVPDIVLAPFGGGGLSSGLAHCLAAQSEAHRRKRAVWGVQSEASCAMALSLEQGAAVERLVSDLPTLAEGLEGGISRGAFARAREAVAGVVVVNEESIAEAMRYAHREVGVLLEGSAAVALVPVLRGLPKELLQAHPQGELVVVLTGRNVDKDRARTILGGEKASLGAS